MEDFKLLRMILHEIFWIEVGREGVHVRKVELIKLIALQR